MVVLKIGHSESGFTYLALLFYVATMGALMAITGLIWSTAQQRERERELLYIGDQFRIAICHYYLATPGSIKRYPATLDDLLWDKRQSTTERYLRRIYADPMTGSTEWGIVHTPDGGIGGVYSLSESTPIKTRGFSLHDVDFAHATHYSKWRFTALDTTADCLP